MKTTTIVGAAVVGVIVALSAASAVQALTINPLGGMRDAARTACDRIGGELIEGPLTIVCVGGDGDGSREVDVTGPDVSPGGLMSLSEPGHQKAAPPKNPIDLL